MITPKNLDRVSRISLRIHGTVLVVVTAALTVAGWMGYVSGEGSFGMLRAEPIGYIGLFQAYLLMTTFGIALWLGSLSERPRAWNLIGVLAHAAPLAANFLFWDDIERYGITHAGVAIHLSLMALELGGWLGSRSPARPTSSTAPAHA